MIDRPKCSRCGREYGQTRAAGLCIFCWCSQHNRPTGMRQADITENRFRRNPPNDTRPCGPGPPHPWPEIDMSDMVRREEPRDYDTRLTDGFRMMEGEPE